MRKIWFSFLIIIIFRIPLFSQESEYQIKAIFLEQFTRFIEWPESATILDTNNTFIIGVFGDNPFGSILENTFEKRKIKNKKVQIRYLSTIEEIDNLHILFISKSNEKILPDIISATADKPILTISDSEGFSEYGVLLNFYKIEDKIKFEINEKAAHRSGLVVSYILFNLAKIVNPIRGEK